MVNSVSTPAPVQQQCPSWCTCSDWHNDAGEVPEIPIHFGREHHVSTQLDPWGDAYLDYVNVHLVQRHDKRAPAIFVGKGEGGLGIGQLHIHEAEHLAQVLLDLVQQARARC